MTTRLEYSTVTDVRLSTLIESGSTDDALILFYIRASSRDIGDEANKRNFAPIIDTHYFDAPYAGGWWPLAMTGHTNLSYNTKITGSRELKFDGDLLELTTLTNGDGSVIASTNYVLDPYNDTPKQKLSLLRSSGISFLPTATADYLKALSVLGVWGYHDDYANAWVDSSTTLGAAITTAGQTTFTSSAGASLKAGWLIKIDSEYLYIVSVATNTVTVQRGVNGSTAATHLISAPVYYWETMFQIESICRQATVLYYNLRKNPGTAMIVDGHTISKPSDVRLFINDSLNFLGANREAFA